MAMEPVNISMEIKPPAMNKQFPSKNTNSIKMEEVWEYEIKKSVIDSFCL